VSRTENVCHELRMCFTNCQVLNVYKKADMAEERVRALRGLGTHSQSPLHTDFLFFFFFISAHCHMQAGVMIMTQSRDDDHVSMMIILFHVPPWDD